MKYFAAQSRKQELIEERISQWERLQAREKLTGLEKDGIAIILATTTSLESSRQLPRQSAVQGRQPL